MAKRMIKHNRPDVWRTWPLPFLILSVMAGCAMTAPKADRKEKSPHYAAGTIIEAASGRKISFETLVSELSKVRVVYVGEQHTQRHHHATQLKVIAALAKREPSLQVGMEMFDRTYQPVLDQWTTGKLSQEALLRQTHWYANWRYDFELYKDILIKIREQKLRLVGLNIPFHIPSKIAVGGPESLKASEKIHLPQTIDTGNAAHREYVRGIFEMHHSRGRDNFEFFYATQCVWEDVMAETIARHISQGPMVVLAGNGHIIHKFGIPDRAFARTSAPFRTLYQVDQGEDFELSWGDYILITPASKRRIPRMHERQQPE